MLLCRYKFLFFLIIQIISTNIGAQVIEPFSMDDCLKSSFSLVTVSHKGSPFGMHDIVLKAEKKVCDISIMHEQYKWVKSKWHIDVCRGPVHIKYGTDAVTVFKRRLPCNQDRSSDFCKSYKTLMLRLQDDGLIFAKGEKEDITSDHGKLNCSFELIDLYLDTGTILSRHKEYPSFIPTINTIEKPTINYPSPTLPNVPKEQEPREPIERVEVPQPEEIKAPAVEVKDGEF